ncbi:hypothetical protein CC2G_009057 [Coprinopsis cinerea AmutBmut pab1-1]|nr:hypothetical protein CC2G_009057 [Coprinopsis cinerea AmutBmut pab1-1]
MGDGTLRFCRDSLRVSELMMKSPPSHTHTGKGGIIYVKRRTAQRLLYSEPPSRTLSWRPSSPCLRRAQPPMNGGDVPSLEEILLQERFDVARAVAFAVLACLSWEACINLSFDVDYFWASTRGIVKTIHYTARSFGVLSQIGSVYIKYYFKYLEKPTDSRCRKWLISQFLALILLMFNLEVLLMTRVYALYDRNYRVAWGLGIFTVLKSTAAAVIVAFTIMRAHFGQACILTWVPQELIVGLSYVSRTDLPWPNTEKVRFQGCGNCHSLLDHWLDGCEVAQVGWGPTLVVHFPSEDGHQGLYFNLRHLDQYGRHFLLAYLFLADYSV